MVYSGKTVMRKKTPRRKMLEGKRKAIPLPRVGARIRRAGRVGTGTEGAYSGSKTIPRHKKGGGKVWKGEGKYRHRNLTSPQAMQGLQVRVKRPRKIGMPRPRPVLRPRPAGGQAMISGMAKPARRVAQRAAAEKAAAKQSGQARQQKPIKDYTTKPPRKLPLPKQYKPKPRRIPKPKPRTTTKPSY